MIWMATEDEPDKVHMVPRALLNEQTYCKKFKVAADELREVAEVPTCIECIIVRLHEIDQAWIGRGVQDDEALMFARWLRKLLMDTDIAIAEEWAKEDDAPLAPGVLSSILEVQVLLESIEDDTGAGREELTRLCLEYSLCPLHRRDYATCFELNSFRCMKIRIIHPVHDAQEMSAESKDPRLGDQCLGYPLAGKVLIGKTA